MLLRSPQRAVEVVRPARASRLVLLTLPKAALPPQRNAPAPAQAARLSAPPRRPEASPDNVALVPSVSVPVSPEPSEPLPEKTLPAAADIMAQARRDLHKIDKEILGRMPAIPAQRPDSMQARLARGIENAFVGDTAEVTDHYTSADGVVYSRVTRGSRSTCFMNGASTLAAATRSGGKWAQVNCPSSDNGWVR
ncbi:hypothetical protein GTP56_16545 [Duganella sp. FT134W]|uniref:Uncharacterized protein n=1 Tax=Duganella margarita TaxID=2692170 RepID=A0A7X4H1V7_9BURK|nr:hypothetical protein [Duganella margarita]MYM73803.1 hypothetical protein [Duganella margarita]